MLKIKKAEFSGCYVDIKTLPPGDFPEVAMVGRSNVGKSSLINKIVNRKNLAKSSSTPGKTRTINYYKINDNWYMVDLPGYGYARVSKAEQEKWGKMIERYLSGRQQLRGVVQLVDIRHPPNENDILMKDQETERWLNTPHHELEDKTPLEVLKEEKGKERLLSMLDSFAANTAGSEEERELIAYMRERIK